MGHYPDFDRLTRLVAQRVDQPFIDRWTRKNGEEAHFEAHRLKTIEKQHSVKHPVQCGSPRSLASLHRIMMRFVRTMGWQIQQEKRIECGVDPLRGSRLVGVP